MQFIIYNNSQYKDVTIKSNGASIELGLLDKKEVQELVATLMNAVQELLKD